MYTCHITIKIISNLVQLTFDPTLGLLPILPSVI